MTKIPQLTLATTISDSDQFILRQGSKDKRINFETIVSAIGVEGSSLPTQGMETNGLYLKSADGEAIWASVPEFPDLIADNNLKYLQLVADGEGGYVPFWNNVLPDQNDNAGYFLTTDNETASWQPLPNDFKGEFYLPYDYKTGNVVTQDGVYYLAKQSFTSSDYPTNDTANWFQLKTPYIGQYDSGSYYYPGDVVYPYEFPSAGLYICVQANAANDPVGSPDFWQKISNEGVSFPSITDDGFAVTIASGVTLASDQVAAIPGMAYGITKYDVSNSVLKVNEITSVDVGNRTLNDSSGNTVFDWQGGMLAYAGVPAIDISSRVLTDSFAFNSLNWDTRKLLDGGGSNSSDWANRQLIANDGATVVVDWTDTTGPTIKYDATVASSYWSSGSSTPVNIKEAIDKLAAAVSGLLGGLIP